ncbi:epoxyqueuosine reductase QueH [Candidatus Endomicrobiellum trichonymphae]|uniref:epoxyqueuosine reductase QueH n=1 Tax=Endomicrobium trichonymphae TaxID=1408204 RepID=UPI000BBB3698
MENKSSEKCNICYTLKLEKTAMFARQNKFDFFPLCFFQAPYQKHDLIKQTVGNFAYK